MKIFGKHICIVGERNTGKSSLVISICKFMRWYFQKYFMIDMDIHLVSTSDQVTEYHDIINQVHVDLPNINMLSRNSVLIFDQFQYKYFLNNQKYFKQCHDNKITVLTILQNLPVELDKLNIFDSQITQRHSEKKLIDIRLKKYQKIPDDNQVYNPYEFVFDGNIITSQTYSIPN